MMVQITDRESIGVRLNKSLTAPLKSIKKVTFKAGEYVFGGRKPVKDIRGSFKSTYSKIRQSSTILVSRSR